ncbi:hypothetical protein SXCC_02687 [Gluconacetobacter sp. SXCC-1]|nr:hypothetical protein SXCC_02687 [Gluconacetobacter sp. SXCC-1]SAY46702.1 hypothetical protein KRIGEM_03398 [Komagataeibacter rhaeticus]
MALYRMAALTVFALGGFNPLSPLFVARSHTAMRFTARPAWWAGTPS